jgi:diguanylate cyclase (GGDEF)-like protein
VLFTIWSTPRQYIALRDLDRLAVRYRELAAIDGTTGLYNRRHFMESAEVAFAHARRLGQPFTALMIDVDEFKQINDVYGHAVGDRVLAEFAQSCREYVRPNDIVGRYGGDEFIIVVPGITSTRAIELADRLTRPTVRTLGGDGEYIAYTISIGIAECPPDADLPTLLMHADLAMYEAKQAGGGGWRIYGGTGGSVRAEPERAVAGLAPAAAVRKQAAAQQAGSVS